MHGATLRVTLGEWPAGSVRRAALEWRLGLSRIVVQCLSQPEKTLKGGCVVDPDRLGWGGI